MKDPFDLDGDGKLNFAERALKTEYMMGEYDEPNSTRSKANPSYTPSPSYSTGGGKKKSISRESFGSFIAAGILATPLIVVGLYVRKYLDNIGALILTAGTILIIIAVYYFFKAIVYWVLGK